MRKDYQILQYFLPSILTILADLMTFLICQPCQVVFGMATCFLRLFISADLQYQQSRLTTEKNDVIIQVLQEVLFALLRRSFNRLVLDHEVRTLQETDLFTHIKIYCALQMLNVKQKLNRSSL